MTSGYYNNMGMGMGQYFNPQQQMSNLINQHPQYFNQAMQQAVQPQPQIQQPQQQNAITTQPPIMQPTNNNSVKVLYVGNREEAFVHPVDLVYSTPSFFFNRGTNEIYMKQYDGSTGNAIFKVYAEQIKPAEKPTQSVAVSIPNDNAYMDELKMIRAGVEGLYRYFNQPPIQPQYQYKKEDEVIDVDYAVSDNDIPVHQTIKKGVKNNNGNNTSK